MTDHEHPEVVAAASLSPVSPRPLHNTYTLPQVLPGLQHQAENPNVVPLEPTTFRTAAAAMAPEPEPTEPVQEVANQESSDSDLSDISIADNESFGYTDGDGGDVDGQEQDSAQQDADADVAQEPDDYARTFDSPAEKEQLAGDEEEEDQQPVSNPPESMNISQQPDQPHALPPTQPAPVDLPVSVPSLADQGAQPIQSAQAAEDFPAPPQPAENGNEPIPAAQDALSVPTSTGVPNQQSIAAPQPEEVKADVDANPADAAPKRADDVDVQPKTEDVDVEMTTEGASDATAIDIQKLVDQITAKAEATDQPATKPPISVQTTSSAMDVDMSSLPPKPALTQEQSKQTYSPATYHHASLPNAPTFHPSTGVPPQPDYANNGAPGISQPQNQSAAPSFASYPNAYAPPATPQQQTPVYNGNGLQQTYEEFLADERKHMAEAKWERFPDGSRIFIGKPLSMAMLKAKNYGLTACQEICPRSESPRETCLSYSTNMGGWHRSLSNLLTALFSTTRQKMRRAPWMLFRVPRSRAARSVSLHAVEKTAT